STPGELLMSADEILAEPVPTTEPKGKGRMAAIVLLVLALGSAAGWYYLRPAPAPGETEAAVVVQAPPVYFTLDPELIVNFEGSGRVRYLQLGIELMTREPKAVDALTLHTPVIRNNLIMLLSDQPHAELMSRQGKEALQQAALEEVQKVMTERYGKPAVETLYFTSFVMQ